MTPSALAVEAWKRLRGQILELVDEGHKEQRSRLTAIILWGVLQRLKYDVSENDVITLLQDLKERGYLALNEEKNRRNGYVTISQIQITPRGRDLLEGTLTDPAVHVLG
jgi:predicted transcriptional regulator